MFHNTQLVQNQTLPFQPISVLILFYWIIAFLFAIILIDSRLMSRKASVTLYFITLILVGIILGGVPNATMFIQETLAAISSKNDLLYLIPALLVFSTLLLSSFLVGRMFCGFLCPLGTAQELLSKIKFKSNPTKQNEIKHYFIIKTTFSSKLRWIFFSILVLLAIFLEISVLQLIDPLLGFENLASVLTLTLSTPFIIMLIVLSTSIFIYRPWCRLFCPFGALSSTLASVSKKKYLRKETCINCGACEKVCPTQEMTIGSNMAECYYCNRCVEACPKDAIIFNLD